MQLGKSGQFLILKELGFRAQEKQGWVGVGRRPGAQGEGPIISIVS